MQSSQRRSFPFPSYTSVTQNFILTGNVPAQSCAIFPPTTTRRFCLIFVSLIPPTPLQSAARLTVLWPSTISPSGTHRMYPVAVPSTSAVPGHSRCSPVHGSAPDNAPVSRCLFSLFSHLQKSSSLRCRESHQREHQARIFFGLHPHLA